MIHIVLFEPKMPSNTGNIIRLCANTGARLHLVEPLGFDLSDKRLRRAGLDYHEYANLQVHKDWQDAKNSLSKNCSTIVAITTKQSQDFYAYFASHDFDKSDCSNRFHHRDDKDGAYSSTAESAGSQGIALVFGSETDGLSQAVREDIGKAHWLRLPMLPDSRSLNLSNAVAICLYEVWRHLSFVGDVGKSVGYESPNRQPES